MPFALTVIVVFLASIGVFAGAGSTQAHDSHGWTWIDRDRIYNFDHKSRTASLSNADWPISILFYNDASPDTIKAYRQDVFEYNCNVLGLCNMNHRNDDSGNSSQIADGSHWRWDEDGGRKMFRCGWSGGANEWALHYRAYESWYSDFIPGGGWPITLWSPNWGYMTPVSTHYDYDDPDLPGSSCDNKQHGYNEVAETNMAIWYNEVQGWWSTPNYQHYHNGNVGTRVINGVLHTGDGNGMMTFLFVPY